MKGNAVQHLNHLVTRFDAIQSLQLLRSRQAPGSFHYEVVERAIDLVLQPHRRIDRYLVRNVLRDAKRIIRRQRNYWNYGLASLDAPTCNPRDDSAEWSDVRALSTSPDPEAIASTRNLVFHIRDRCRHRRAESSCLDGMLSGETPKETAQRLGFSEIYIKKLRARVRASAAELMGVAA
jgi:hypothetical protein